MESRVCGGCGGGGFLTLTTTSEDPEATLHRLAYFQRISDTPPHPTSGDGGSLRMAFFEVWSEEVWRELFGDEPTIAKIGALAQAGFLRLSRIIKSPLGITRARIYDSGELAFEPEGDEMCENWPTLHKNIIVRYKTTTLR